ncbi:MAG: transcriptional regulator [Actinobacteria bacterium]|nr:transcriptional regulator [Actinomycetota bacterium]
MALWDELRNTYVVKKVEPDKTRDQVARTILENGPATAAALAEKLEITPAGIRRHLDSLVNEGVLSARDPYQSTERGRGRPSKVFVMTDVGREKFEHSYDDLAVSALKFMASKSGDHLVNEFAISRADDLVRKGASIKSSNKTLVEKSKSLAKLLTKEGYSATAGKLGNGEEVCQHHCPIAHVASEFPQLCEAETKAFSEILGTHVQRLATIAHGDGVCTTFIPNNLSPYSKVRAKEGAR